MSGISTKASSQSDTTVTVRFANPTFECGASLYCLDVQFLADTTNIQVFGMNVRFFYDDFLMEIAPLGIGFRNFAPGYMLATSPDPFNPPTGPGFIFGSADNYDFENSVIMYTPAAPPTILSTVTWTTLYQVCFVVDPSVPTQVPFCPPVIWDLESNPVNGGFLPGDDGVVITIVDHNDPSGGTSLPSIENVVQFNWVYSGPGTPPYGMPLPTICTSIDCSSMIVCAADTTIQCTQSTLPTTTGFATATDNCPGTPVITFSDVTMAGNCPHNFSITRTWIATNTCGGADTCVQLISVIDTTGPSIMCPTDITVQCAFQVPSPNPGSVTATDDCGGATTIIFLGDAISNQTCADRYTVKRTYRANDVCGNSSTCTQTIQVQDNTPPGITCPNDITVQCQSDVPVPNPALVTATDVCSPAVITHLADVISNVNCDNQFIVSRIYRATDACGNSATCTQTIRVFDNIAPMITCPQPITVSCANMVPVANPGLVTSTDNCSGVVTNSFVADVITGMTCTNRFTISRIYRATDVCGNSSTCAQTITVFDNTPPSIACPGDITVQCANQVPLPSTTSVTTSDNCGGVATVTFVSDVFSNQICTNRFDITRTYRAIDECGNSATCAQNIHVFDTTPPSITCPVNTTVQCASLVPLPNPGLVIATDNCNGLATVTFVDDVISAQTCINRYNVTRTYRAIDECGNSATCSQTITVFDNMAPFIMCPGNITVQCASQVPLPNPLLVTASDNCNGLATVSFVDDVISNQTCTNRYNVTRTYRAIDECGNSASCSQTITVFDNTVPFILCPGDITVQCASLVPPANPTLVTASDNCNGLASVTFVNDVITNQTCTNRYNLIRTYRATDECGNSATCAQTITVFDNTVPFIMCPGNVTVQCASQVPQPNTALVTVSDNCNGIATVTFVGDVTSNQTCVNRFNVTRTYRATDECGNSASCSQTITVFDNTVPFIMCPGDVTVQCASQVPQPNTALVTVSDNCNGIATVTFVGDVTSNQTCTNRFNVTRTYRATDECGNSATCSQTITVFDNTVPFIMCPGNVTVQCASLVPQPNIALVTVSDNCNGMATVTFVGDVTSNQTCVNRFNVTRTYRATDECGNSATCSQTITVFDNTVPFIMCPGNVTVQCASLIPQPNIALVTVSDNCNGVATVTFVGDVTSNQTCVNRFNVTRTYRATDECGNSATCAQTITVFDNTVPFIMCPGNVTVQCASQVPVPNTTSVIASDNCNGLASVTFVGDVISNQTCTNRYDVTRTYRATDECGNSATCSQTIFVFDNTPPVITCPTVVSPVECSSLSTSPLVLFSEDFDGIPGPTSGGAGTYTFPPGWLKVNVDNRTPNAQVSYINEAWERREDFQNNVADSVAFSTSYYTPVGAADDWMWTPPVLLQPSSVLNWNAKAYDPLFPDGYEVRIMVAPSVPSGSTGALGNMVSASTLLLNIPNENATWTARSISLSAYVGQTVRIAFRNISNDQFLLVIDDVNIMGNMTGLPNFGTAEASDNCNPLPTVTFADIIVPGQCPQQYSVTRTWTAVDDCGNSASCSRTIDVVDTTPPSITCPPTVNVQCASEVPAPNTSLVVASDNCGTSVVSFVGDAISNQTCVNRFNLTRTYRATDQCGNSAICTQLISVFDNTVPFIMCPGNVTVQCASLVPQPNIALVTVSDNCNGMATVTFVDDVISNQTCTNRYNVTRTYRATDECGNSATCAQTITVFDNTVPFIMCPGNVTVQCASQVPQPNTALVTVSDNCNGIATVTFVGDAISNQTCTNRYNVTRTYRATDECGNSATCSQTITVFDNTVPFIMCPGNITVQCASQVPQPNTALVTVSDNCNGMATVTFVDDVISNQTCTNRYNVTRTYRATDECGNSATCSQSITVFDNTVPFIMCPGNVTVQCASQVPQPNTALVTVSDNCNGMATVTFVGDVTSNQTCVNRFNVTRTYRATDECGNSATCSQTITVFDNTVPFIMCPGNVTVQCASLVPQPNIALVTVSDNCNGMATVTFVGDVTSNQTCVNRFNVTRTYRATDECGNSATCAQTITVFDNTVPFIMCPGNVTVQCASLVPQPNTALVTVSDNCNGVATVTFVGDVTSNQTCVNRFNVTRTYRATDECGNSATCSQTITVFDNTVPFIMCPGNVTVQCASLVPQPNIALVTVSDNCNGMATVTFVDDVISNQTCTNRYNVTRTYRATDECGNSATCSQTITVFDNTVPFIMCPGNITVQCANLVPQPNPALVTASDNCNGVASVTFVNDVVSNLTCTNRFNITRTYRATDECGNSATCSQTITVFDNTVPFIMCPGNVTVQCASQVPTPNPATVTVSDNCNGIATVTFVNDVISNQTCVNRFNVTRTYRATDECGNSASCSQTITVFDNTVPFIMCPGNVTVQCASDVPLPNTASVTASDNCNGLATVTFVNDVISNQTCTNRFNVTRTYRATDECGNSSSCSQTITVFDNIPPTISCPPNVVLQCTANTAPGGTNGTATATDNCAGGGPLPEVWINEFHYDNTGVDAGEFIEVAGPAGTDLSVYSIVLYNGTGGAVYDTDPLTGIIPNQSNGFGTMFLAYPSNGIQNGAPDGIALVKNGTTLIQFLSYEGTFVGVGGPANGILSTSIGAVQELGTEPLGLSLNLTGNGNMYSNFVWAGPSAQSPGALNPGQVILPFTGVGPTVVSTDAIVPGACPQAYTINRTWRATDACGNSSSCLQTLQVIDNTPPSITCPINVTVQCASQVPVFNIGAVASTDNCGGITTVTFVNDVISNQTCTNRFNVTRTYRATDQCGNSATCSQTITVFDNTVPTIMCPGNVTVDCAFQVPQPNPASVTASDNCSAAATVTFLNDVITNQTCNDRFNVLRTYIAVDECGNSATCSQTITVFDNIPPVFMCPGNVTVQCASQVPAPVTEGLFATDNCSVEGFIPVAFIGDVIANQTCTNRFNVLRTYSATDACGNSSSCIQTITVFDNTVPTIMCPGNVTVQCASQVPQPNPALVTASDNCNGLATVSFVNDVISNQTCINRFNVTRTYRAVDECGNSATCSQTITVFDNIAPSIQCPGNVTVQCANQVPAVSTASVVSSDNCGGAATISFVNDVVSNQTCTNRFVVTRTYRATDACGNSSTCSQTISVFDNIPPSIQCPGNVTVQCANQVPAVNTASVVASDNCGGGATVTFVNDVITNQTCADRFNVVRTYRATDACGNSASCSQTIVVFDNIPPTIMCPGNITVQCANQVPTVTTAGVVAADNCGGGATVTIGSDVITNQTCINRFNVLRTFRATDACGNSATCTQTIVVFDNTPPTLTVVDPLLNGIPNGGTLSIQCLGQDPSFSLPTFTISSINATDNCSGNVTFTFNQVLVAEGNCAVDGFILRYRLTWSAIDACGNSSSYSIFMDLVDHVAPTLHNVPPDITVNCDEIPPVPTNIFATDECLCACIIVFNESQPAPGCQNGQVITRTWRATDDCGNQGTSIQHIKLVDHKAPELIMIQPELANVKDGDILNYTCNEGGIPEFYDHLSAESINSPVSCGSAGIITFDVQTKVTNNCKRFGYLEQRILHWRGVDLCGNVSNLTITARLIDNEAPVLIGVPDTTCVDDPALKLVDATDNCGHPFIRFWDTKIPNPCGSGFAFQRTYEAYDACGNSVRDTSILIPNDHAHPNLIWVNPILKDLQFGEILIVECNGQNGKYTNFGPQDVRLEDACSFGTEVLFEEKVRESGDCADGVIAVVDLTWSAQDICGNQTIETITAHVVDTTPPVILNFKPEITIGCNQPLPKATATDNCGSVDITTQDTTIPGDCAYKYDVQRIITATDHCGNVTTQTQIVHVGDSNGPVIQGVVDELCDDLSIPEVTAFDECAGKFVEVTMTQDTLDVAACKDGIVVERIWSAVDICGDVATIKQMIIVGDKIAPVIEIPTWSIILKYIDQGDDDVVYLSQEDIIKQLNDLDDGSVYVHDNCDTQIIPVFTLEVTYSDNCAEDGYFEHRVYTWVATDACGNSSSISFSVNIMDDIAPIITDAPKDASVICAQLPPVPPVHAIDPAGPVTVTYEQIVEPGGAPGEYKVTRRWTARDACGNVTVAEQHILWIPDTFLSCDILLPASVQCNSHGVVITGDVNGGLGTLTYYWEVLGEACFIQAGQGTPSIDIYVGWSEVTIRLTITDAYGCSTTCGATIDCVLPGGNPFIGADPATNAEAPNNSVVVNAPPVTDHASTDYLTELNLWPNPANGSVNLSFESSVKQDVKFTLLNYLGQVIHTDQINAHKGYNSKKVDVSSIPEGSYLMQVKSDRSMYTKVIVILHND
ncbi:MAG: T9SS type A sorting domain-containing protein [Saprospiraceae bacterium]|uniref:T9SS type A sorting domain-containing protein n=1 Tax=Candidatus Opimibacter skivensis TaxID=2982028 RepID=A0A9D7STG8_9BACT|nr:T9SS type A sorting domain-containing protein [Candidatus Opimibacter skivensis]